MSFARSLGLAAVAAQAGEEERKSLICLTGDRSVWQPHFAHGCRASRACGGGSVRKRMKSVRPDRLLQARRLIAQASRPAVTVASSPSVILPVPRGTAFQPKSGPG